MRSCQVFIFLIYLIAGCENDPKGKLKSAGFFADFDWQGHRGARGLAPENTIPAFLKALEFPVKTLELDVVISSDSQVVVSHDPWMSSTICISENGKEVDTTNEVGYNIYKTRYEEISKYDCGSKRNERFPDQKKIAVAKPLLKMLVDSVREYCKRKSLPLPWFNIEIKSRKAWDDQYTPEPGRYVALVLKEIKRLGILNRTCIQSFDTRALQEVHRLYPDQATAFLIEENFMGLPKHLNELGFIPTIFSPDYNLLTKDVVSVAHEFNMKVIPWTVDDTASMNKLIKMGVDGIITDYPNLIGQINLVHR